MNEDQPVFRATTAQLDWYRVLAFALGLGVGYWLAQRR